MTGGPDTTQIETAPIYDPEVGTAYGYHGPGISNLVSTPSAGYEGQSMVHTGVGAAASAAAPFTYGLSLLAPLVLMGAEQAAGVNNRPGQTTTTTQPRDGAGSTTHSTNQDAGISSLIGNWPGGLKNLMSTSVYPKG